MPPGCLQSLQLPPGLANLPKTLSALPVTLSKQTLLAMGLDSPSAARQAQLPVAGSLCMLMTCVTVHWLLNPCMPAVCHSALEGRFLLAS